MNVDPKLSATLAELKTLGIELPSARISLGGFGDSPELSAELIGLIVQGGKRGTCSLLWAWDADGVPVPQVGDIEIVLDHLDRPALVKRILTVEIVAYCDVGAEFAALEGEGDLSLAYWRAAHWDFFGRECERIGRTLDAAMPLVCETFEVLHVFAAHSAYSDHLAHPVDRGDSADSSRAARSDGA